MNREDHMRQLRALLDAEEEEIGFAASLANENSRLKYLINLRKLQGKDLNIGFVCFASKEEINLRRNKNDG